MANDGFVITKKHLKVLQLNQDLAEINTRRFKNLFTIDAGNNTGFWELTLPEAIVDLRPTINGSQGFTIELLTVRRLSFRHVADSWSSWAQAVFQEELAVKYAGTLSDEGIPDRWQPDLTKFPTFRDWLKLMNEHILTSDHTPPNYWEKVIKTQFLTLPPALQQF